MVLISISPLVIAYSPTSPYASQLNMIREHKKPLRDLFTLMQHPGFHVRRTNPSTDPQGQCYRSLWRSDRYRLLPTHIACADMDWRVMKRDRV